MSTLRALGFAAVAGLTILGLVGGATTRSTAIGPATDSPTAPAGQWIAARAAAPVTCGDVPRSG